MASADTTDVGSGQSQKRIGMGKAPHLFTEVLR
jgi:hypothetical protein